LASAERHARAAAAIAQRHFPDGSYEPSRVLNVLALVLWDEGRFADALPVLEASRCPSCGAYDEAVTAGFLARVHHHLGHGEQAEALYREAISGLERAD